MFTFQQFEASAKGGNALNNKGALWASPVGNNV